MKPDEVMTLYDYAWWARDRLLEAADGMTDEEFAKEIGFTYGSLRGILAHAMEGEMFWCARFDGGERPEALGEDAPLAQLRERWAAEESRFRAYLAGLTEAALEEDFTIRRRTGEEIKTPLWMLLTHVVNHGTQHRSEAAEALTMAGRSPGSLDLTTFVWERGKP